MKVFDAIRNRRSVRRFRDDEVPEDTVNVLIDSLIWAPSAGNLQSRKFFFVTDETRKYALSAAAHGQGFIGDAPLVVVGCTDAGISERYGDRGVNLYSIQDVSASVMCMMLAAFEAGLGTVWVGAFNEGAVAEVLGLPGNLRPVAIVPVGYPARVPAPPPRVTRDEAVSFI